MFNDCKKTDIEKGYEECLWKAGAIMELLGTEAIC